MKGLKTVIINDVIQNTIVKLSIQNVNNMDSDFNVISSKYFMQYFSSSLKKINTGEITHFEIYNWDPENGQFGDFVYGVYEDQNGESSIKLIRFLHSITGAYDIVDSINGIKIRSVNDYAFSTLTNNNASIKFNNSLSSIGNNVFDSSTGISILDCNNCMIFGTSSLANSSIETIVFKSDNTEFAANTFTNISNLSTIISESRINRLGDYTGTIANISNIKLRVFAAMYDDYVNTPWNEILPSNVEIFGNIYSYENINYYYLSCDDGYEIVFVSGTVPTNGILTIPTDVTEDIDGVLVTTSFVSLGSFAFNQVKTWELENVILPDNLMYIDNCIHKLNTKAITISQSNEYFKTIDGILYSYNQSILISYPKLKEETRFEIPSSVNVVAKNAFDENYYLNEIVVSNSCIFDANSVVNCYNLSKLIVNHITAFSIGNDLSFINCTDDFKIYVISSLVKSFKNVNNIYKEIYNRITSL